MENCVAYTGTHDNETLVSWMNAITKDELAMVRDYLFDYHTPKKHLYKSLIALAMRSVAKYCIVPMQDYLGLDNSARMNHPSTIGSNWRWRLTEGQPTDEVLSFVADMTRRFGRINPATLPEEDEDEEELDEADETTETKETAKA